MSAHKSVSIDSDGVVSLGEWDGNVLYCVARFAAGTGTAEIVVRDDGLGDWVSVGELADGCTCFPVPPWIEFGVRVTGASGIDLRVCIYSGEK